MSFSTIACRTLLAFFLCALLWTYGCSKINQENYDKIEMGMDYSAVVDIFGQPDGCQDILKAKDCTWGGEEKNINIKFVGGKVIFFKGTGL